VRSVLRCALVVTLMFGMLLVALGTMQSASSAQAQAVASNITGIISGAAISHDWSREVDPDGTTIYRLRISAPGDQMESIAPPTTSSSESQVRMNARSGEDVVYSINGPTDGFTVGPMSYRVHLPEPLVLAPNQTVPIIPGASLRLSGAKTVRQPDGKLVLEISYEVNGKTPYVAIAEALLITDGGTFLSQRTGTYYAKDGSVVRGAIVFPNVSLGSAWQMRVTSVRVVHPKRLSPPH